MLQNIWFQINYVLWILLLNKGLWQKKTPQSLIFSSHEAPVHFFYCIDSNVLLKTYLGNLLAIWSNNELTTKLILFPAHSTHVVGHLELLNVHRKCHLGQDISHRRQIKCAPHSLIFFKPCWPCHAASATLTVNEWLPIASLLQMAICVTAPLVWPL